MSLTYDNGDPVRERAGWWGTDTALTDEDEARRRLVDAAIRCLVRHGSIRFPIDQVASEAGVARSTVYRYFRSRDELVLGVLLSRADAGMARMVAAMEHPHDAAVSITDLVMSSLDLIRHDPVNSALYSDESRAAVTAMSLTSDSLTEVMFRHVGPLLDRWRADGQLHADLELREVLDWVNSVTVLLLAPPWSRRTVKECRALVERYLVRALVAAPLPSGPGERAGDAAQTVT